MSHLLDLQEGEEILLKVRKHWLVGCYEILPTLIGSLIVAAVILGIWHLAILPFQIPGPYIFFVIALLMQFTWCSMYVQWLNYYLDIWVVSNHRIVNINQRALFERETTVWLLDRIQEVTIDESNILESWLGFGTIEVQTAGPKDDYAIMEGMKDPEEVQTLIMAALDKAAHHRENAVAKEAPEKSENGEVVEEKV